MKKNLFAIFVIIFIIVLVATGTKFQSVDDYYLTNIDKITSDSETVFLSIDCSTLLEEKNWNKLDPNLKHDKYVPSDGKILAKTEYVLRPKDTVFDMLYRATRYNKIHIEFIYNNGFGTNYVQGINQLYEFSCGDLSGWMYKVNGIVADKGCSQYKLKDGDYIEWVYTCNSGADVVSAVGGQYESI